MSAAVEKPSDIGNAHRFWLNELELAEKWREDYINEGNKVIDRYMDKRGGRSDAYTNNVKRYNVLWSNVQTLGPALYARTPVPEAVRSFKDRDPVGRVAAELLERALVSSTDDYDFDGAMGSAVEDYLLPGMGQVRVRYVAETEEIMPPRSLFPLDGMPEDYDEETAEYSEEDGSYQPPAYEVLVSETAVADYVYWKDFLYSPCRVWEECRWVGFRSYMTRKQLVDRFGEKGREVTLDYSASSNTSNNKSNEAPLGEQSLKQARVWEIWDKTNGKVIWFAKGYKGSDEDPDGLLERSEPHLNFQHFFPCPKPLFATMVNGKALPRADYEFYRDQASELDVLTDRIAALTDALRVNGWYAGDAKKPLEDLFKAENKLIPVEEWAMYAEKGGIDKMIAWFPIQQVATVLISLYEAREKVKQDLYEITGIADIIRGATAPSETATAQRIKGQFATLRLSDRQKDVQRFAKDIFNLTGEILAERMRPETLLQMGAAKQMPKDDYQYIEPAIKLLKDERLRGFRVDIETDSTLEPDEQAEKQARTEFVGMAGTFLQQAVPAAQQVPELAPLLGQMLMFGIRGFKVGRSMEGQFEQALERMTESKEDPQMQQMQQQMQQMAEVIKQLETDRSLEVEKLKADIAESQGKQQLELVTSRMDDETKRDMNTQDNLVELAKAGLQAAPNLQE